MDHQSMDTLIRSLTPREVDNLNGFTNTYTKKMRLDHLTKDGKGVYTLPPQSEFFLPIILKKHSRFQHFPLHIHELIEINYMYSGNSNQKVNGNSVLLKEGHILFLDTQTNHELEPLGENDILINILINKTVLTNSFFSRLSSDSILAKFFIDTLNQSSQHNNYVLINSESSSRLRLYFNELLCEWFSPSLNHFDIMINLFILILSELVNIYEKTYNTFDNSGKTSTIHILKYIESNYKTCDLSSTAAHFNLSPNYLSNLLRKNTGSSFLGLVHSQKIESAKNMLKYTELSVSEIANNVGYKNISFFYKKFKEIYNCLPGEYRLNN